MQEVLPVCPQEQPPPVCLLPAFPPEACHAQEPWLASPPAEEAVAPEPCSANAPSSPPSP